MKLKILMISTLMSLSAGAQVQQTIYKDAAVPDACPLKSANVGTTQEYLANSHQELKSNTTTEPYTEGCLTLKTIYVNNLLSALQLNYGENTSCYNTTKCGIIKGSEEIAKTYKELVDYISKTQKADVKAALQGNNNNVGPLIVNQVQVMAQLRYTENNSYDLSKLPLVNQNIKIAFGIDLNLKGREVDAEKMQTCADYALTCPLITTDPTRMTERCRTLLKSPMPAYCTAVQATPVANLSATAAVTNLTDVQAEEYLNLNLDVKAAYAKKAATDTRTKTQYASDHYRDFSEAEGRPRSVKEYINCNPDVAYAFSDPTMNTNLDEAKTDLTAFVAKHFQYLIQPIVPVSSRNFSTFGCIDLEKYLLCNSDVKDHCAQWSNGDKNYEWKNKICAANHYKANGKAEGRTASCGN